MRCSGSLQLKQRTPSQNTSVSSDGMASERGSESTQREKFSRPLCSSSTTASSDNKTALSGSGITSEKDSELSQKKKSSLGLASSYDISSGDMAEVVLELLAASCNSVLTQST